MNRQQAIEFIQALNTLQPHVAPLLFGGVAATDVVKLIAAVANGQAVCDVRPTEFPAPSRQDTGITGIKSKCRAENIIYPAFGNPAT